MSIAITGAAGQLGRLVIDDLLSAGIPGTDLIAIVRAPTKPPRSPTPECRYEWLTTTTAAAYRPR